MKSMRSSPLGYRSLEKVAVKEFVSLCGHELECATSISAATFIQEAVESQSRMYRHSSSALALPFCAQFPHIFAPFYVFHIHILRAINNHKFRASNEISIAPIQERCCGSPSLSFWKSI